MNSWMNSWMTNQIFMDNKNTSSGTETKDLCKSNIQLPCHAPQGEGIRSRFLCTSGPMFR